jgi:mRNA interferase YafQ
MGSHCSLPPVHKLGLHVMKRLQKRGKDLEKLKKLIELLLAEEMLPPRDKDHPLKLNWAGYRDAHVEPAWVLIYSTTDEKVHLERTGTHEDLFE